MTETVVATNPVTDGVITLLKTTGFPIGDAQAPPGGYPHAVVYPITDFDRSGPQNDGQADVVHQVQITSVGVTRTQAQRMGDVCRQKLTDTFPTIAGRLVLLVELADATGGVTRDDDSSPALFAAIDIYRITTTPA